MIIDMNTHIFVKDAFKEIRKEYNFRMPRIIRDGDGKEFLLFNGEVSGPVTEQIYDPKKRVEDMNREKVDL